MSDLKTLLLLVLAMGGLAAIWWFGWFGPVADQLMEVKRLTTYD
jgi:hypothetical protein